MKLNRRHATTTGSLAPGARLPIVLGLLSVVLFWVPLLAPFVQIAAVIETLRAARWGVASGWSLLVGWGGAVIGFALFLAIEYLWII